MRNQLQPPPVSHLLSLDHIIRRYSAHYFLKLMSRTYFPTQICVTSRNDGYNSLPQRTYIVTFDLRVSLRHERNTTEDGRIEDGRVEYA